MIEMKFSRTSNPKMEMRPAVGRMSRSIIRMLVVFPAPFSPRNP